MKRRVGYYIEETAVERIKACADRTGLSQNQVIELAVAAFEGSRAFEVLEQAKNPRAPAPSA